ncbi:MAG: ATP-binding protein [Candidatus Marinimicrobia bacterium]|nr:ATP-binding protein [Candidatus Neomarinimicrobiota bacterium]
MNYKNRHLEAKLQIYSDTFPALLLTGARQVGKSTLLKHIFGNSATTLVFDPVIDIHNVRQDPEFFLKQFSPPLILDEIQYAPELLPLLKRKIDEDPHPGQYFLTGSQNLALINNISESMAGRVICLNLWNMTHAEISGSGSLPGNTWTELILKPLNEIDLGQFQRTSTDKSIFTLLWRGGYPGILDLSNNVLFDVFQSYVRTYIERDIRRIAEVSDQQVFTRFVSLCAALTAQEINYSKLGRELGLTPQTANRWIQILKATYQWIEIPPYSGNTIKRLSGKPKGYFTDTGLAAHLQRISTPETLSGHPLLGALFETFIFMEIHKRFAAASRTPNFYHWRTHAGAEVDLIMEIDGIFRPVEIKCKSSISITDARGILQFRKTYPKLRHGPAFIIAVVDKAFRLADDIFVIPFDCT